MSTRERSWPVPVALVGVVAVAGLLVAISALWLTLSYEAQPGTGDLLYVLRLAFGSAMAACLVLTLHRPVRRRALTTGPQHAGALS